MRPRDRPRDEVERIDAALSACAREEAALRLRLGQMLEVLGRSGGCFALGFSSLGAYALERAERSSRWVEGARCLARRLESLPLLRRAVASGVVSWSMGELLARVAVAEDEAVWIARARGRTLREVRLFCEGEEETVAAERDACTLRVTVDREEAWLFEATRALLEALGTRETDEQVEALLAEGQDTLLAGLPRGVVDLEQMEGAEEAQQRWLDQLRRWRAQAEELCEPRIRAVVAERGAGASSEAVLGCASLEGKSARELDGCVRALASALAGHELRLARLLLQLHRVDGWRRLGYATEGQYARERLGCSRSSLLAKRALALRLERLPHVVEALSVGSIGVEAALQLVRIASPRTEAAWVQRARRRTVKHLREEVAAALVAVRLSGEEDCPPPFDAELEAFQELERAVVSGQVDGRRAAMHHRARTGALGR